MLIEYFCTYQPVLVYYFSGEAICMLGLVLLPCTILYLSFCCVFMTFFFLQSLVASAFFTHGENKRITICMEIYCDITLNSYTLERQTLVAFEYLGLLNMYVACLGLYVIMCQITLQKIYKVIFITIRFLVKHFKTHEFIQQWILFWIEMSSVETPLTASFLRKPCCVCCSNAC